MPWIPAGSALSEAEKKIHLNKNGALRAGACSASVPHLRGGDGAGSEPCHGAPMGSDHCGELALLSAARHLPPSTRPAGRRAASWQSCRA